ncbi:Prenyltransferase phnF [Cladobotryum mycophilum]|uniref:Prenyltransferase phnF n=1 Tax=Cladobotryum mycophilum TaxID=491253 RepID=A0ABR0SGJ4_9HYPO
MTLKKRVVPQAFWWDTTGRNLADMLDAAQYPEHVRRNFLRYYYDVICPALGAPVTSSSFRSALSWDGSPIEYSYSLNGSTKEPEVRLSVDLSPLHPQCLSWSDPLGSGVTHQVVEDLISRNGEADAGWYNTLREHFRVSVGSPEEARELVSRAGHKSSVMLGFDIERSASVSSEDGSDTKIPAVGKVYFLPCLAAVSRNITRWQVIRNAVQQLPTVYSVPQNIIKAFKTMEHFFADKTREWEDSVRYLATDLLPPHQTRLKIYTRCPSKTFDVAWDLFTLGGRIPGLEREKERFRDLFRELVGEMSETEGEFETDVHKKVTICYHSLSAKHEYPVPKLFICPRELVSNDSLVVSRLDKWLHENAWTRNSPGATTYRDLVEPIFTHRELSERSGMHSFISIAQKNPVTRALSIQTYFIPELYSCRRTTPAVSRVESPSRE